MVRFTKEWFGLGTPSLSAQLLMSYQMKKAQAVEPLRCNCRGMREEKEECQALYRVST